MIRVGARLRAIRLGKRIGLRELARMLPVSHAALSQYESGESRIDADMLPRIAEALGVSPCAFFEEGRGAVVEYVSVMNEAIARIAGWLPMEVGHQGNSVDVATPQEMAERAVAIASNRIEATVRRVVREELAAIADPERPGPAVRAGPAPFTPGPIDEGVRDWVEIWQGATEAEQALLLEGARQARAEHGKEEREE